MTGLVFATLSKFIEIGNILKKPKQAELEKPTEKEEKQNKR